MIGNKKSKRRTSSDGRCWFKDCKFKKELKPLIFLETRISRVNFHAVSEKSKPDLLIPPTKKNRIIEIQRNLGENSLAFFA